jgi:hypothetical protein
MQKLSERAIIQHFFFSLCFTGVVGVEQSMPMPRPLFFLKRFWLVAMQSCQTRYQSDPGLGYFCSTFWQKIKQISQSHNSTWSGLTRNNMMMIFLLLLDFLGFLETSNFLFGLLTILCTQIKKKHKKGKQKENVNTHQYYFFPIDFFFFFFIKGKLNFFFDRFSSIRKLEQIVLMI